MNRPKALRWQIEDEIKRSSLPADSRHILWVLLSLADVDTGAIPAHRNPSYSALANDTALARSTVAARLKELRRDGWLIVDTPSVADQVGKKARNRYQIRSPTGPSHGLVRQADQSEERTSASPGHGPDWSGGRTQTGPGDGLTTDPEHPDHQTSPAPDPRSADRWHGRDRIVVEVEEFLGQPAWTAERVRTALLAWESSPNRPRSVDAVAHSLIKKQDRAGLLARLSGAEPASPIRPADPPPCGECDARPGDPPTARLMPDETPCPRCYPERLRRLGARRAS
jgi:hypothetical protein